MTYPAKFRKKLQQVMERDELTIDEVALRFDVGSASVSRWKINPEPKLTRNKPATKINMDALKIDVEKHPDSFLSERAERFLVSASGIRYALQRLGFSRKKKTLKHPKADDDLRAAFEIKMAEYKAEGRVIAHVDESGFIHENTRSHGYAKIGKRCFDQFNWEAKSKTNAIGALLNGILLTLALFKFNINSDIFYAWVTQDLLPKLPAGSVIVMDNASFHKREDIIKAIQNAGCIAEFLPAYSPDFNPIEHTWAQIKSIRNKMKLSVEELFTTAAIGHLFIVR